MLAIIYYSSLVESQHGSQELSTFILCQLIVQVTVASTFFVRCSSAESAEAVSRGGLGHAVVHMACVQSSRGWNGERLVDEVYGSWWLLFLLHSFTTEHACCTFIIRLSPSTGAAGE